MKKTQQFLTKIAILTLFACLALGFTSCDKDNKSQTIYYSMGFESFKSSDPNFLSQINAVEQAFMSALGTTTNIFTREGTIQECDEQVRKASQSAADSFDNTFFDGSFVFTVTNSNSSSVVYTFEYEKL